MGGQIVDASIIAAPKQRNTNAEKRDIKEGRIPAGVGGQARQARAEGPGRPLDGEVVEGQTGRGRFAAHGPGGARLRLREPCRH